ncbi:hypothetical protein V6N12_065499 [Hibiscus sabdariffa]|uniref:Uncharacterized protein n=1 Tax=Hibiscus sabdariffa TaxID=183260 RepID=A0ABR2GAC7_9ROSI
MQVVHRRRCPVPANHKQGRGDGVVPKKQAIGSQYVILDDDNDAEEEGAVSAMEGVIPDGNAGKVVVHGDNEGVHRRMEPNSPPRWSLGVLSHRNRQVGSWYKVRRLQAKLFRDLPRTSYMSHKVEKEREVIE